ncbi:RagB/SusD family nutrient uptake outer membrane protein [Gynurincola endophyticus]|uniref:RagB/SusD family nutrient uptake outer membrane protein n=1 Tax=Gynurincola endophyticus TaxID=2479004 RepID=UPI000F8E0812|nr:RagB/SusD family nutrient uptake outer membrane protein [Gynurincola endophyticus]
MNYKKYIVPLIAIASITTSCSRVLDLKPLDKLDGNAMFSDPQGVKLYMANLYYQLPVEDFNFLRGGFNDWIGENMVMAHFTDEATHSEYSAFYNPENNHWWEKGYKLIRDVNIFSNAVPDLKITEDEKKKMIGESAFIKAYSYFALVKRYGGIPLIDHVQQYEGDVEVLKVPRSTEKESWDFVMNQCDIAILNLPETWPGGERRATKWVAAALKSRAALHAASIAKFGENAILSGDAASRKLVGIDKMYANDYYRKVIEASELIMSSNEYSLYKPNPASPEEAAENYRKLFEDPNAALEEAIFIKGYTKLDFGHNYDIYFNPAQTSNGWPHPGRMNPALELVDLYESYTQPGVSTPVRTSSAANDITDYRGFDAGKNYYHFDNPYDIFKNKDARLWGSIILPGTNWKQTEIVIQAGFIKPDGTPQILSGNPYTHTDGKTYHIFGSSDRTQYSGFDSYGGNYTRTGFAFKKFLNAQEPVVYGYSKSLTDYIDFRYAEVLLNYAEAVAESGITDNGAVAKATDALNAIRRRAGHTQNISLTAANVYRERRIELAFENKRFWDLIRRREYHTLFDNTIVHALLPVIDLRVTPAKYIFLRTEVPRGWRYTFDMRQYYRYIPGIGSNNLIQNPQY